MLKLWWWPFWQIVRLQRGPQDIPHSLLLLLLAIGTHVVIDMLLMMTEADLPLSLWRALIDVGFMAVFVYAVLQVSRKSQRWLQTLTALVGIEVLLGGVGLLLMLIYSQFSALAMLVSLMWLGLLAWNVICVAHIFRHALETHILWGIVLGVLYIFLTYHIINGLAPLPEA